jgi:glycosyltransferase involved in cell wall biosynthesis
VGRQEEVKDPMTLLQGFIQWTKIDPNSANNTRLVFIGDGRLHQALQIIASNAGVADWVWFAGDRSDVAELMQCFDIFLLPSINEGISNTILEAMATGLPVVATRVGGNPELVADRQNGYLVERQNPQAMAEAIKYYVENPEIALQHGMFGRKICVERFSLDRMVKDYMDIYDQVLEVYG